jgi:hypothetical protein
MPINVEQLESDIFLLHWNGDISINELRQSHVQTMAASSANNVDRYIHIIVATHMKSISTNINAARQVLLDYPNVIGLLIVDAPRTLTILAGAVNTITRAVTVETFATVNDARLKAHTILGRPAHNP